jgi:hypothetical protein
MDVDRAGTISRIPAVLNSGVGNFAPANLRCGANCLACRRPTRNGTRAHGKEKALKRNRMSGVLAC